MTEKYQSVFVGVFFALLTLLVAEFMASSFGLYEKDIKAALLEEALEHTEGVVVEGHERENDLANKVFKNHKEADKTARKAWVYLKRAHAHGEGLGAIALAVCLLIGHTALKRPFKKLFSIMVGLGSFGYPFTWFYAGTMMVDKGKAAAKADVHWLAVSSVFLYLGALVIVTALLSLYHLHRENALTGVFFAKDSGGREGRA